MGMPVVTVAAGGLAVIDVTAVAPKTGTPVEEASNGFGRAITKVTSRGIPVVYVTAPLVRAENGQADRG